MYSYLPNTTPWVIIRTGVGFPSLGFYYCPWFSLFPTLGYYPALGFLFFPPLATIQPLVLTSSHPWLLFSPWFSTFTHPWLRFLVFSSLVYNISHPWFFTFSNPWLLFSSRFFLIPTLGCSSALGFPLFQSQTTIQPFVFPLLPTLGLYSAGVRRKQSQICLKGKLMTTRSGNIFFLCSFQQLPRLFL